MLEEHLPSGDCDDRNGSRLGESERLRFACERPEFGYGILPVAAGERRVGDSKYLVADRDARRVVTADALDDARDVGTGSER